MGDPCGEALIMRKIVDLKQGKEWLSVNSRYSYMRFKFRKARSGRRVDREASDHDVDERGQKPTKSHSTGPIITNSGVALSWPQAMNYHLYAFTLLLGSVWAISTLAWLVAPCLLVPFLSSSRCHVT